MFSLGWLMVTLLAIITHVTFVSQVSPFCFVLLMAGLLFLHRQHPLAGFVVYLQILMYQNIMVSLLSEGMARDTYTVVAGTSFAAGLMLIISMVLQWLQNGSPFPSDRRHSVRTTIHAVSFAIGVIILYTVFGMATAGMTQAALGFRNASAMLFAIIIGLDIGNRWGYRTLAICFLTSAALGVLLSCVEIGDPVWFQHVVNGTTFVNLKTPEDYKFSDVSTVAAMTSLPFNTGALSDFIHGVTYRFGGPNMHSISYGYVLAIISLVLVSLRSVLVIPVLVLLFMIGVKGAAILFLMTVLLYAVWQLSGNSKLLLVVGLCIGTAYLTYGLQEGLRNGDFHVLGFLGGVHGFMANPLGHGLGNGGNLSTGMLTISKWQKAQATGSTDVALESAVGVLLYQMGIGVAALIIAIGAVLRAAAFHVRGRRPQRTDLLFIGLCVALLNGVFQEEAYSPYAAGLVALFCGVLVANGQRPGRVIESL